MHIKCIYAARSEFGVIFSILSSFTHPVFLRGVRRGAVQPMRAARGERLLLPQLPLRGPQRERARGEEPVSPLFVVPFPSSCAAAGP